MRKQATITRWNADKGFGFMRSAETPADVFFHIRDWRGGGTPPAPGLVVDYEEIHVGGKGPRGVAVRPVGEPRATTSRDRRRRAPAVQSGSGHPGFEDGVAIAWMALVAWCCMSARLPPWLLVALGLLNLATFFAYSFDKYRARNGLWRTPEQTLHAFSLLGGWPAAALARRHFRHKSSKASFLARDRGAALVNIVATLAWAFVRIPA